MQVFVFLAKSTFAYLGILLFAFLSLSFNKEVYPGLIPGPPFTTTVMTVVGTVVAPLVAGVLFRRDLWWSLELALGAVQLGAPVLGRRIPLGDVLLIRLGLDGPDLGEAHLPVALDVPGILGWRCRVWLSRADAKRCFKELLAACPSAIGIDQWGAERMPKEGLRSAEVLKRVGYSELIRGVVGAAAYLLAALGFLLPGILYLMRLMSGDSVAGMSGSSLVVFALPGFTLLLGMITSARVFRKGRARVREAEEWAKEPVPELSE